MFIEVIKHPGLDVLRLIGRNGSDVADIASSDGGKTGINVSLC